MSISPELLGQVEWVVEDLPYDKDLYYNSKVTVPSGVVMDILYKDTDTNEIIKISGEDSYFLDGEGFYRKLILKNNYDETTEKELINKILYTESDRSSIRDEYFNKTTNSLL